MELPNFMILESLRYCIGRETYVVKEWVDWAIENWKCIPEYIRVLIKQELTHRFYLDNLALENGGVTDYLGSAIDKEQWQRLYYFVMNAE